MVLTDSIDTEPFPSKKIVDCQSIPTYLCSGPKAGGMLSSSWGVCIVPYYLNIELKVKFQVQALI